MKSKLFKFMIYLFLLPITFSAYGTTFDIKFDEGAGAYLPGTVGDTAVNGSEGVCINVINGTLIVTTTDGSQFSSKGSPVVQGTIPAINLKPAIEADQASKLYAMYIDTSLLAKASVFDNTTATWQDRVVSTITPFEGFSAVEQSVNGVGLQVAAIRDGTTGGILNGAYNSSVNAIEFAFPCDAETQVSVPKTSIAASAGMNYWTSATGGETLVRSSYIDLSTPTPSPSDPLTVGNAAIVKSFSGDIDDSKKAIAVWADGNNNLFYNIADQATWATARPIVPAALAGSSLQAATALTGVYVAVAKDKATGNAALISIDPANNLQLHFYNAASDSWSLINGSLSTNPTLSDAIAPAVGIDCQGGLVASWIDNGGAAANVWAETVRPAPDPSTLTRSSTTLNSPAAWFSASTTPFCLPGQNLTSFFIVGQQSGQMGSGVIEDLPCPPAPTVTSLSPDRGPLTGGTTVVLEGTNLTAIQEVSFGNVAGVITSQTGTTLTVVTPAQQIPGAVNVRLVACDGTVVLLLQIFTYQPGHSDLVCPPRDVEGKQVKKGRCFVNILTWKAPKKKCGVLPPSAYHIYQDPSLTQLIGTVPATFRQKDFKFKVYGQRRGRAVYFITSVDPSGNESSPKKVVVKPKRRCSCAR